MDKLNNKILGWIQINWSDISPISEFLSKNGWERIIHEVVFDAVPSHLILYENKLYDFVFYPKNLPDNLKFVNLIEFENFILSKNIIIK